MAFAKKTWKDRIAEFPTRRRLTKEDNTSELVTVAREEGTLSQEGDAFSAENMNDLENRIDAEFTEVNGKLENKLSYHRDGIKGYYNEYYTASYGFIILEDYVPYEGTSIANWEAIKFTNNLINAPLVSVSNIIRANGSTQYTLELMVDTNKNIYLRNSSGSNIDISNGVTGYLMFLI